MSPNINVLPLELLFNIVSFLNLEDFVKLKMAWMRLGEGLNDERIHRQMVRRHIAHSKEAKLADQRLISYSASVQRTFRRREAYALAKPYSALILGSGTSFVYRDGILCYVDSCSIRILNVHQAASVEQVIDLERIGHHCWKGGKPFLGVELRHCQDGVLSFIYRSGKHSTEETWLIAVDIRDNVPIEKRVRLVKIVQNSRFFVRNDSNFLYVGSYDGLGCHGHREWIMQGYDMSTGLPSSSLQLPSFFGSDLRQTLAFEIYGGYLYALSNQSSFEVEEIDWTSYYHCYRFPLHQPTQQHLERLQIFRRQHREGPINDSWTDLSLHKDERTGCLFINECRREWKNGHSAQLRTYYSAPLLFSDQLQDVDSEDIGTSTFPADDPLVKVLDEKSRANWSQSVPHLPRNYHPEPDDAPHSFLLAKTKYRTFIPPSLTYLDLVIDDWPPRRTIPGTLPLRHWQQQIRLRLGSRIQCSPIDLETKYLHKPALDDEGPIPDSEERYKDRGISLWPPTTAPMELFDLLNPAYVPNATSRMIGDVAAVADERSLVYMSAPLFRAEGENSKIVLVNFDCAIKFRGLDELKGCGFGKENWEMKKNEEFVLKDDVVEKGKGKEVVARQSSDEREKKRKDEPNESEEGDWWSEESAKHLEIRRGFKFEYRIRGL